MWQEGDGVFVEFVLGLSHGFLDVVVVDGEFVLLIVGHLSLPLLLSNLDLHRINLRRPPRKTPIIIRQIQLNLFLLLLIQFLLILKLQPIIFRLTQNIFNLSSRPKLIHPLIIRCVFGSVGVVFVGFIFGVFGFCAELEFVACEDLLRHGGGGLVDGLGLVAVGGGLLEELLLVGLVVLLWDDIPPFFASFCLLGPDIPLLPLPHPTILHALGLVLLPRLLNNINPLRIRQLRLQRPHILQVILRQLLICHLNLILIKCKIIGHPID